MRVNKNAIMSITHTAAQKTPNKDAFFVSDIATLERERDQTLLHGDRKNRSEARPQTTGQRRSKAPSQNQAKKKDKGKSKEKKKEDKTCKERCQSFPFCCVENARVRFHSVSTF